MSIDAKEFTKGNSLIVGKKIKDKNNEYEIDGVLVYDAYCLSSSKPFLLQCENVNFIENEPIYICGHGDGKNHTISECSMKKIAEYLYDNTNFRKASKIVIMSCHGRYKADEKDKDMPELLHEELLKFGINMDVIAVSENTTIVVDYFGKAIVTDKKYLKFLFSSFQTYLQNRIGCLHLKISSDIQEIDKEMESYFSKYGTDIAIHNYTLLQHGGYNYMDKETKNFYRYGSLAIIFLVLSLVIVILKWKYEAVIITLILCALFTFLTITTTGIGKYAICYFKEWCERKNNKRK